ncbi:hypothetical protein SDC9_119808 [bioreactor metagenome]|uniref:Uncharacterized protein n=1 Tax=bioreactor metagenome TaxID=1076179 RepID=A0A645C5B6_9ZZZZ
MKDNFFPFASLPAGFQVPNVARNQVKTVRILSGRFREYVINVFLRSCSEVVQPGYGLPESKEVLNKMAADEAGCSGDEP